MTNFQAIYNSLEEGTKQNLLPAFRKIIKGVASMTSESQGANYLIFVALIMALAWFMAKPMQHMKTKKEINAFLKLVFGALEELTPRPGMDHTGPPEFDSTITNGKGK